jgi:hypothetical protein
MAVYALQRRGPSTSTLREECALNAPTNAPLNVPTKSILDLQVVAMQTMMVAYAEALQFWPRVAQAQMRQLCSIAPERRTRSEAGGRRSSTHDSGKRPPEPAATHGL